MSHYIKEKLISGYKGIFVIHDHFSDRAPHHFDLRLSFPVESTKESLIKYNKKRDFKNTPEPQPLKGNLVLRSWAIPKHVIPTSKALLATETEDHEYSYRKFKGVIPEGNYGAGIVKIFDQGTYELIEVLYDKKYVILFKGEKLKGLYYLIKTGKGKQFLWGKIKNKDKYKMAKRIVKNNFKQASIIDYVRPTMNYQIWDGNFPPKMKDSIRDSIINILTEKLMKNGFKDIFKWITNIYLSGSMTSFNYKEDGDVDIDIEYDASQCKEINSLYMPDDSLYSYLKEIIYQENNKCINNTQLTFSYLILKPEDKPVSEGVYDILNNKWIRGPIKIPENFDPDTAFKKQYNISERIARLIDLYIGRIIRLIDVLKKIDQYNKFYDRLDYKKDILMSELKSLCQRLDKLYNIIRKLPEESKIFNDFPAFNFSPDWEEKNIVFKYLARSGYHRPIAMLYSLLKGDPYLDIIDRFIPD